MPEIDIGIDAESEIESYLENEGYEQSIIGSIITDIVDEFFLLLAADLSDGESEWPVDTGYSEASFYADGDTLQNHASYSIYVEGNTGAVESYVADNVEDLIQRALDFVGIPRPEATRQLGIFGRFAQVANAVSLSQLGERRFIPSSVSRFRGISRFARRGRRFGR